MLIPTLQPIETRRLIGSPLRPDHLQELCRMHQDPRVMAMMGGIRTEKETEIWLSENLEHWNSHRYGIWMFRDRRSGQFVGRGGLRQVEIGGTPDVELGYALLAEYWRCGLGTEMARAALQIGFQQLALESIVALISQANTPSLRLAEKLNFQFDHDVIWKGFPITLHRLVNRQFVFGI